eukprot:CAMPEP_0170542104 /NCGR_PEP_ID=MMETSP0211-20121228/1633_1 /TAXON_ID=311385 /ORGANISM="Pseudokeronopsis sp., Strain OXSARD2" /LENGTH=110 /DNA_ID=CAMNT_0010845057 /DNA_START=440 /DNA_END=772 /DNA_ORIENTATION=+
MLGRDPIEDNDHHQRKEGHAQIISQQVERELIVERKESLAIGAGEVRAFLEGDIAQHLQEELYVDEQEVGEGKDLGLGGLAAEVVSVSVQGGKCLILLLDLPLQVLHEDA